MPKQSACTLPSSPPQRLRTTRASFFFFNDTATTEIYTLSLHDALPISARWTHATLYLVLAAGMVCFSPTARAGVRQRSEEHTSELQSRLHLVCRLLLEKKKTKNTKFTRAVSSSRRLRPSSAGDTAMHTL